MATDPFIKLAEQIEQEATQRKEAAATGSAVTIVPGDPTARVTTTQEPQPMRRIPSPGGAYEPEPPARLPPISTSEEMRGTTEAPIPEAARDPFISMAEQIERKQAEEARGPDLSKGAGGFLGRSFARMASSFNAVIADATGDTLEGVDYALRELGSSLLSNPTTARKQVHDWMNKQGMATQRISGVAGGLGQAAPEGLVWAAALIAAAPAMVGLGGANKVSRWLKGMGEVIEKYPGLVVAQEIGATMGARTAIAGAAEAGLEGTAQFGAGLAGAVAGGGLASLARAGLRGAGRLIGVGKSRDAFVPPGSPPIREAVDVETAKVLGERMIQGERLTLENALRTTVDNAANLSLRDPGMASSVFRRSLGDAADMGRGLERTLWAATRHAKMTQAPSDDIINMFSTLRAEVAEHGRSGTLPNLLMRQFERQNVTPAVAPAPSGVLGPGGTPIMTAGTPAAPRPITVGRLLGFHSDLIKAMANERRAPARGREINRELIQNLVRIDEVVLDQVARALPNDTTIAAARAFSRAYNEMFTRGPIAQILGAAGRNEAIVAPELAVQKLLKQHAGSAQVARIGREIPVLGPGVRAEFEQAVRSEFREIAETGGPEAAARFMVKIEPSIAPLGALRADLAQASDDLLAITQSRNAVNTSALSKFTSMDSHEAIRRLMNDPRSPTEARAIMATLGRDPAAASAFKAGVIDNFIRNSHGFPSAIREQLDNHRIARTMAEIFTPAENARFSRLVDVGVRVERGDETLLQKFRRGGLPILAGIFGAQTGRTLTRFTGGGTIQTPGLIAGITRKWAQDTLLGIPLPELMARAVLDPRWEKILLSRPPETTKEARAFIRQLRLLIRTEASAMNVHPRQKEEEQ